MKHSLRYIWHRIWLYIAFLWMANLALNLIGHDWNEAMLNFNIVLASWLLYQHEKRIRELREMLSYLSKVLVETIEGNLKWQKQNKKKAKPNAARA